MDEIVNEESSFEYLPWRGVTKDTMAYYNIKTKVNPDGRPEEIGFTYPDGATKIRNFSSKDFRWTGEAKPNLFGLDKFALGADKSITITEGEIDAASLWQVLRLPVVSVRSAGSAFGDLSAVRQQLNAYERIYLAFDGDAAGRDATARCAKLFDYNKVYDVRFTNRKDANEYLSRGETSDLLSLWHNAGHYVPDNISSKFSQFEQALTQPPKEGLPYPFPTLTSMTYGLRTGEVVLLKAPEKVGKTSLMHAFLVNILKRTNDNVAAIFLEEPRQRLLQSIAGLELGKPVHLPDSSCTGAEIFDAVKRVVKADERLHIYDHFGADDPDLFIDTIRFLVTARACRYVLLDHISILSSGLDDKDERRRLEYLATRLEMLVKELDFSLIMVSHVNDQGQTRGSHYLTKLADITLDAKRDTMAPGDEGRRIHLSIPFNRFCARTGDAGVIEFDPLTYTLKEDVLWQTNELTS